MENITPIGEITMKDLAGGELQKLFDEQLSIVRKNIADKRTWIKATREVVIRVIILPTNEEYAQIVCKIGSKLAPISVKPAMVDLTNQQYFKEQGFTKIK